MRRGFAVPASLVTAVLLLPGAPAVADAPVAHVQVQLADPLMVDPVQLQVTATDAGGDAVPFSGTVTLTTGRTSTTDAVSGDAGGTALAELATGTLSGGDATAHVAVSGGGGSASATVLAITTVPVGLAVAGFGCSAITPAGGTVQFAVTTMNGAAIPHPASTGSWELAYATLHAGPVRMVDGDGLPLSTSGTLAIRSGTRTVATIALPKAVRPLVFGVSWSGRVGGRFTPGTVTAALTLTDSRGRQTTASRPVHLVRAGSSPCR